VADRGQWTLWPECLDDFINESNPVRVVINLQTAKIIVRPTMPLAPTRWSNKALDVCLARMEATHFLNKTLAKVAAEMALSRPGVMTWHGSRTSSAPSR